MHNSGLYTTAECTAREGFRIMGYSGSAKLLLVVHIKGLYTVPDQTTGDFYCIIYLIKLKIYINRHLRYRNIHQNYSYRQNYHQNRHDKNQNHNNNHNDYNQLVRNYH